MLFLSTSIYSNVLDDLIIKKIPGINQILIDLIAAGLSEETDNENSKLGKEICLAGGRSAYDCIGATIGKEICLAGGRSAYDCIGATIGKGICLAGGRSAYDCIGVRSVQAAIEKIPYKDRTYWWDRFRDQNGNTQWRCRGGQTKQFASNSKCSNVNKDDDRWPG